MADFVSNNQIFSSVILIMLAKLLDRYIFESINEHKKIESRLKFLLVHRANIIPKIKNEEIQNIHELIEVQKELREVSAHLFSFSNSTSLIKFLSFLKMTYSKEKYDKLSGYYMGWSNSLFETKSSERQFFQNEIYKTLGIERR